MHDEPGHDLAAHYYALAEAAARGRKWADVADLVEDVLVLDPHHSGALTLQTLAERYLDRGKREWGRRHETILFADLVGSTDLGNRFDPEFIRGLIRSYERACTPVLSGFGGHVHRFLGDGILASFGYPSAHEDDARRAVQAGLDLVRAVEEVSSRYDSTGAELQVRVGIASGLLVHGDRGSGAWSQQGDLFGPPVNLAARLHEVAEPGEVCVSGETATLVEGFFVLEPMGARRLKGFGELVPVHRVLERTTATGWVDRHGAPSSPFIGRAAELRDMEQRFAAVASNASRHPGTDLAAILVVGEPGVGKSRLCRELIDVTADAKPVTIELQCSSLRMTSPLYPVRIGLERYAGIEPGDNDRLRLQKLYAMGVTADAMACLAPLLDIHSDDAPPPPELTPMQLREATLRHLFDLVKATAERATVVLLIEDVHWADPTTRLLLERVSGARLDGLLTVVTSRVDQDELIDAGFRRLVLAPLSHDDARALALSVGGEGLPAGLADEIATRSDGIPLFVEQLADTLKREGELAAHRRAIPTNLTELLQARLDAAGPSKQIAQLASVIGREFDPDLVAALAQDLLEQGQLDGLDRPVEHHLTRLLDGNIVEPGPDDTRQLRFHHALLTQTAYESQLIEDRLERHEALAKVLLRFGATGRPADPAVVAHHFDEAHCPIEALTYYLAAATRAQSMGALAEMTVHLTRADELLAEVDEPLASQFELAIRLNRGLLVATTGGYGAPDAVAEFGESMAVCRRLKDHPSAGSGVLKALFGLWCYYYSTGGLAESEELTAAIDEQLAVATLPAGRPSYHACKGVELFCKGEFPASHAHFATAIELIADDDVDPAEWYLPNDPLAAVYAFLSPMWLLGGEEERAVQAAAAGLARCEGLAFPWGPFSVAFVRTYESWMHRERGDLAAARIAADHVIEVGERHGFVDWAVAGRLQRAAADLAAAPTVERVHLLGDAIQDFRVIGEEWILSSLVIDQGWGSLAIGDYDQTEMCIGETEDILSHGQRTSEAELLRLGAELTARLSGPLHPSVADDLQRGMRFALDRGALLFVLRCGTSYERWLGADALSALDDDLLEGYRRATARFGSSAADRERFLRTCGPSAVVSRVGV